VPLQLLSQVRAACEEVASTSTRVWIDHSRIAAYASSLAKAGSTPAGLDPRSHHLGHHDDTLAFFVTLDAINFGSGYFPYLRKRPGTSGYFTIARSLKDHYDNHGRLSAQDLARITREECTKIFGQDAASVPAQELMQLFATALNDLGNYLLNNFTGSFVNLVEHAGSSAERLVELLAEMPFFNDIQQYGSKRIPFYKRAQLTAADLSLAFKGTGPGLFNDLHQLTIFADNLVPHVLRIDGILNYDLDLAGRIDGGELIPSGSREEIEIRACAVHAAELLVDEMRRSRPGASSMELDYTLWNRGQQPYYKNVRPRHRTRTVFY
jgi:hypothetical protein